jgi:hypothetical protein
VHRGRWCGSGGAGGGTSDVDLDVVYGRSPENVGRLVLALTPYHPYLRGAPPGLPFRWDAATVQRGLNFTLTTDIGDLDVLGEIVGGGSYEALLPFTLSSLRRRLPSAESGPAHRREARRWPSQGLRGDRRARDDPGPAPALSDARHRIARRPA